MGRMKEYAMQLEEEAGRLIAEGRRVERAAIEANKEADKEEEVIIQETVEDGREDLIFALDIEGESVNVCTIHQEFLDVAKIAVEKRLEVAQGMTQMFMGMLKPFMDLAGK